MSDFNPFDEGESKPKSALFAKTLVEVGYKFFLTRDNLTSVGATQDDSFFPAPGFIFNLEGKEDPRYEAHAASLMGAKNKANEWYAAKFPDGKKRPFLCLQFSVRPSNVYGKTVTWAAPIVKTYTTMPTMNANVKGKEKYVPLYEIIFPAVKSLGMVSPGFYFLQFKYVLNPALVYENDPALSQEDNNALRNKKTELLYVPDKIFSTEEEISKAATEFFGEAEKTHVNFADIIKEIGVTPEMNANGYTAETILGIAPDLAKALKAGTEPKKVAEDYALPMVWVARFKAKLG